MSDEANGKYVKGTDPDTGSPYYARAGIDSVTNDGGTGVRQKFVTTATQKGAQGMYIEVYEDRVVFSMKNFGAIPGFETGTERTPFTAHLYRK